MEAWIKRCAEFASRLILSENRNPSVVPYIPSKCEIMKDEKKTLPRIAPKRMGVSEIQLLTLVEELEREVDTEVHSLMVVKQGQVVLECNAPGYSVNTPHLSHSMSKVLTALAVGLMFDDGKLSEDTKVRELFPEYTPKERHFSDITVRHLLTMSSGVRFNEAGVVSETEWGRAFFESEVSFLPGTRFEYNSMNTYILALIVKKLSGVSLTELVTDRILSPLGIENFYWELSPEGCEKGGFGVFMSLESWVKIGLLVLGGGVYDGRRILSSEWIEKCISQKIDTPKTNGRYAYGYQIWVSDDGNILFSGMLGQTVLMKPELELIIAVNGGNNELFHSGNAFAVIDRAMTRGFDGEDSGVLGTVLKRKREKFFESREWIELKKKKQGLLSRIGLAFRTPYPEEWNTLLGRFDFADNGVGLLPVFIRTMQNNFGNCISSISFVREGGRVFFVCLDGERCFKLEIGFFCFCESEIEVSGEKYRVSVHGGVEGIGDSAVYKLEFIFPEMPNRRRIEIRKVADGAFEFKFSELPGDRVIKTYINEVVKSGALASFVTGIAERRLGEGFLEMKLGGVFSPVLVGAKYGSPSHDAILEGERERARAREKTRGMLESLILHHFDREEEGEEPPPLYGRISETLGRMFDKVKRKKD